MDTMAMDTKLVQVFLTATRGTVGVYEVSLDVKNKSLFCNCPGFRSRTSCKHVAFVKARVNLNDGTYPLELDSRASDEELAAAQKSSKSFRDFVIKYGTVEIL